MMVSPAGAKPMTVEAAEPKREILRSPLMGEIRVRVTITNSMDEMRHRRGEIAKADVRAYVADAVVDTGAVRSVIPTHVKEKLGVLERGHRVAEYADGRKDTVEVTEPLIFDILGRDTLEEALVLGDEVLIGQTVLEKLDLLTDCANRRLVPNPAHPDQPVSKVK
jgi:clan AA aspartic protease